MSDLALSQGLIGAKITTGPQPWQVIQRNADGYGEIALEGTWYIDTPYTVQVRVASEYDGSSVPGCDWRNAQMLPENSWRIELRVPTGGLYRIESRLCPPDAAWCLTGDKIWHIAVGDIWVIAGQSNAVGFGHGTVVDPPALGVSLFGVNEIWRLATHPIFDPTGTKHPVSRDTGWIDVSPWLSFGKTILEQAGVPVGLIPAALGGSPLSAWDPGNENGAYLFDNMADMIETAGGRVAGMVWYQGCSDGLQEETARTYLERFTRFVECFRAKYGANSPVITAQINRYCVLPDDAANIDTSWSTVREAQRQAARMIPNLAVLPTLDLPLSDLIHTSAAGNVILGQRFGQASLGMVYGRDTAWKAADVRSASFTDSDRKTVRLAFDDICGGLVCLAAAPMGFLIEDNSGSVPVVSARVETRSDVVIELARSAVGRTLCHNMFGCNPTSTFRDHLQRPLLAFYGLEVQD